MKKLNLTNRKGSALLVALLVMAVLISISLALSTLVLRETRITREFLDAGQAYYSAESGIELALYNLKNKLPGWQPVADEKAYTSYEVGEGTNGDLRVKNRCQAYPCFDDEEFNVNGADPSALYGVLDLNQSITVPLFVVGDAQGQPINVKDFRVQYYVGFDKDFKKNFTVDPNGNDLSDWDVLRWKIFGIDKGVTDSVSDFISISKDSDEKQPSWFGSFDHCEGITGIYSGEKIGCRPPPPPDPDVEKGYCNIYEAREYYAHSVDNKKIEKTHCKRIGDFLSEHTLNYLTLTNQINPTVLNKNVPTKIYFRIELFGSEKPAETVREYADISANGYAGNSKQSINVKIKRGSFMPVFNFALYSTYVDKTKTTNGKPNTYDPGGYWEGT